MIENDLSELTALCQSIPSISNFEQQKQAYQRLETFISNPINFNKTLQIASSSQTCLFVICQVLTKCIIRLETESISIPFRSVDPIIESDETIYSLVIQSMYTFISNPHLQNYVVNSCINLVAICLKYNLTMMSQIQNLRSFLQKYFPGFQLQIQFMNNLSTDLTILMPKSNFIPQNFQRLVSILISLLDHVTLAVYFGNYYEYRRYVYTFKNNYLAGILEVCTWYLKILIEQTTLPPQQSMGLRSHLSIMIRLFEMVVSYPFSLSLQQFEFDEQLRENCIGEIYFPNYFRNITGDTHFINGIYRLYAWYNTAVEFDTVKADILNILRIMGRICSANSYYFDNQQERRQFRFLSSDMLQRVIQVYRSYDDIYTNALLELCHRVLNSYTIKDYENCISNFLLNTVMLCQRVIDHCPIKLQNREHNPTSKAFDVLCLVFEEMKSQTAKPLLQFNPTQIKIGMQQILQTYLNRLCNPTQARQILQFKFKSYDKQVDTYEQIFKPVVVLFRLDSVMNFRKAIQLDVEGLSKSCQVLWIHFVGTLLQEVCDEDMDEDKVRMFLRMLEIAQVKNGICSLRYINIFINKILSKIDIHGTINSCFWMCVNQISQSSLNRFVQLVIKKCTGTICESEDYLGYSLDILSTLYNKLRRNKVQNLNGYSSIFRELLQNLEKGVFTNPKLNKMRTKLYQIVSNLWISNNQIAMIYQVYSHIRQRIQNQMSLQNFILYMYDITGLIGPVQAASSYKILLQLILKDMQVLNVPFFQLLNVKHFLAEPLVVKVFIKFSLALTNDLSRRLTYNTQSALGLELEALLHTAVKQCATKKINKKMFLLLRNFIKLCPIRQAIPLPTYKKQDLKGLEVEFDELISSYFDNIQRVTDLATLYPFIQDRLQMLLIWYEEAVRRQIPLNYAHIKTCIDARIWRNQREKETVAKLMYMVGSYDDKLQIVPQLFVNSPDQGLFTKRFNDYYK